MSALVAIPTRYKGYQFRSRLEARWAGFFELMGVPWEYEPEGFTLPSGRQYLPDFRLTFPRADERPGIVWCEVKPEGVTGELKFDEFARCIYEKNTRVHTCANGIMFEGQEIVEPCALCNDEERLPWQDVRLLAGDPLSYYGGTDFPTRFVCPGCLGRKTHEDVYSTTDKLLCYSCEFCDDTTPFGYGVLLELTIKESTRYSAWTVKTLAECGGMKTHPNHMAAFCESVLEHAHKARAARLGG